MQSDQVLSPFMVPDNYGSERNSDKIANFNFLLRIRDLICNVEWIFIP